MGTRMRASTRERDCARSETDLGRHRQIILSSRGLVRTGAGSWSGESERANDRAQFVLTSAIATVAHDDTPLRGPDLPHCLHDVRAKLRLRILGPEVIVSRRVVRSECSDLDMHSPPITLAVALDRW